MGRRRREMVWPRPSCVCGGGSPGRVAQHNDLHLRQQGFDPPRSAAPERLARDRGRGFVDHVGVEVPLRPPGLLVRALRATRVQATRVQGNTWVVRTRLEPELSRKKRQ